MCCLGDLVDNVEGMEHALKQKGKGSNNIYYQRSSRRGHRSKNNLCKNTAGKPHYDLVIHQTPACKREEISTVGETLKIYWVQWDSLKLLEGLLQRKDLAHCENSQAVNSDH